MYPLKKQHNEVCRMPWFLVEVGAEAALEGSTEYFVVHSVDINEMHSSFMYVNGIVRFEHSQRIMEGKVLLASEDRSYLEQEVQRLNSTSTAETTKSQGRFFFVQYSNTSTDLVHAVVPEADLLFPPGAQQNPGEVIIKAEQNQYVATVLLMNEDEKQMENEFEKLKNWCLQKCLNQTRSTHTLNSIADSDDWILVQYCKASSQVVYAILNQRETHWTEHNLYKDVVAYVNVDGTIFQALVLDKSRDFQSLIAKINNFKECAALSSLMQMERIQNNGSIYAAITPSYKQYADKIVLT